jgi:hypothetical protein
MSQTSRAIFAASAVALTLGVVPLAAGRDLTGGVFHRLQATSTTAPAINRATKADRATVVASTGGPTRTISLHLDGLTDTSVLVRIPVAQAGRSAPEWTKPGNDRPVACEPVVSVLTDIAKRLQAGRCVT